MGYTPIGRLFESEQQARNAMAGLSERHLPQELCSLIVAGPDLPDTLPQVKQKIVDTHPGWVPDNHAAAYANQMLRGYSLVLVSPLFGRASEIERILQQYDPISLTLPDADKPPVGPTPLSDFLGIPTLKKGRTFEFKKDSLMDWLIGYNGRSNFRFSSLLHLPLLSKSAAPLSSLFGLSPLADKQNPGDKSFGLALTSDNPAPLSSKLGLKTVLTGRAPKARLINNPAPLSSMFGLPVLKDPHKSRPQTSTQKPGN